MKNFLLNDFRQEIQAEEFRQNQKIPKFRFLFSKKISYPHVIMMNIRRQQIKTNEYREAKKRFAGEDQALCFHLRRQYNSRRIV